MIYNSRWKSYIYIPVPDLGAGLDGKVMLQNLPSIAAAMALSPPPGSRVLDMCAAPGGENEV